MTFQKSARLIAEKTPHPADNAQLPRKDGSLSAGLAVTTNRSFSHEHAEETPHRTHSAVPALPLLPPVQNKGNQHVRPATASLFLLEPPLRPLRFKLQFPQPTTTHPAPIGTAILRPLVKE